MAVTPAEVEKLSILYHNGLSNGVQDLELLDSQGILRHEPHCTGGLAAIYSPNTGIVSYREVTESYGEKFAASGGKIELNFEVEKISKLPGDAFASFFVWHSSSFSSFLFDSFISLTLPFVPPFYSFVVDSAIKITSKTGESVVVNNLVTCGGLHSDRLAAMAGGKTSPPIVAFRGEFLRLQPQHRHLVKGLIYPVSWFFLSFPPPSWAQLCSSPSKVPDSRFPFLGVHFTKKIDGNIDVGPNAVLAFAREGYKYTDINLKDLKEFLLYRFQAIVFSPFWFL